MGRPARFGGEAHRWWVCKLGNEVIFEWPIQTGADLDSESGKSRRDCPGHMHAFSWQNASKIFPTSCSALGTTQQCAHCRFFENVPDELSKMRTPEAETCADRHLRCTVAVVPICARHNDAWSVLSDDHELDIGAKVH